MQEDPRIAVIGLGYVGLPLAVSLSARFDTIGYDVDSVRIAELKAHHDRTGEVTAARLTEAKLRVDDDAEVLKGGVDIFIVTVPTPVNAENEPDLGAIIAASEMVGRMMAPGAVVVYESTVYPGVTEDVCGPALERVSGLFCGKDFFLGYSPERINPGDTEHTIDKITKVVAGQTDAVAARLRTIYGAINGDNIFVAKDIKTAEAAKVIENAQRDINIAFVNEIAMIFGRMGLSVYDVLDAANTKWNFLPFSPGLVGGHCIGVDPFYLAHAAEAHGHDPRVILSGRRVNDSMGLYIADRVDELLPGPSRVLVLGITFKENVPDIRNSKVVDLIRRLQSWDHAVTVWDPLADPAETKADYGIEIAGAPGGPYDCIVGAVPHDVFRSLDLAGVLVEGGTVADLKRIWSGNTVPKGLRYWCL